MQQDRHDEVFFVIEVAFEKPFDRLGRCVHGRCLVPNLIGVELRKLDRAVGRSVNSSNTRSSSSWSVFQHLQPLAKPGIGGQKLGEIAAVFPCVMAVQIGDQKMAVMSQTRCVVGRSRPPSR